MSDTDVEFTEREVTDTDVEFTEREVTEKDFTEYDEEDIEIIEEEYYEEEDVTFNEDENQEEGLFTLVLPTKRGKRGSDASELRFDESVIRESMRNRPTASDLEYIQSDLDYIEEVVDASGGDLDYAEDDGTGSPYISSLEGEGYETYEEEEYVDSDDEDGSYDEVEVVTDDEDGDTISNNSPLPPPGAYPSSDDDLSAVRPTPGANLQPISISDSEGTGGEHYNDIHQQQPDLTVPVLTRHPQYVETLSPAPARAVVVESTTSPPDDQLILSEKIITPTQTNVNTLSPARPLVMKSTTSTIMSPRDDDEIIWTEKKDLPTPTRSNRLIVSSPLLELPTLKKEEGRSTGDSDEEESREQGEEEEEVEEFAPCLDVTDENEKELTRRIYGAIHISLDTWDIRLPELLVPAPAKPDDSRKKGIVNPAADSVANNSTTTRTTANQTVTSTFTENTPSTITGVTAKTTATTTKEQEQKRQQQQPAKSDLPWAARKTADSVYKKKYSVPQFTSVEDVMKEVLEERRRQGKQKKKAVDDANNGKVQQSTKKLVEDEPQQEQQPLHNIKPPEEDEDPTREGPPIPTRKDDPNIPEPFKSSIIGVNVSAKEEEEEDDRLQQQQQQQQEEVHVPGIVETDVSTVSGGSSNSNSSGGSTTSSALSALGLYWAVKGSLETIFPRIQQSIPPIAVLENENDDTTNGKKKVPIEGDVDIFARRLREYHKEKLQQQRHSSHHRGPETDDLNAPRRRRQQQQTKPQKTKDDNVDSNESSTTKQDYSKLPQPPSGRLVGANTPPANNIPLVEEASDGSSGDDGEEQFHDEPPFSPTLDGSIIRAIQRTQSKNTVITEEPPEIWDDEEAQYNNNTISPPPLAPKRQQQQLRRNKPEVIYNTDPSKYNRNWVVFERELIVVPKKRKEPMSPEEVRRMFVSRFLCGLLLVVPFVVGAYLALRKEA